jgi:hypothetical protein
MAKCHVIEKQSAEVVFSVILKREIAFIRHWVVVGVYVPQNPHLIPDDFRGPPPGGCLDPDGWALKHHDSSSGGDL